MANYKNKETGEVAELIKDDTTKVLKLQSTGKEVIASKFQFKNEWEPIDEPQVTTKEEPVKESEPVFGSKENDEKAMNAINAMTNKLMKDVKKSTSKKATTKKEEVKSDKPEELPNNVAPKDLKEIAKDINKKGVKGVPENLKKVKKTTAKKKEPRVDVPTSEELENLAKSTVEKMSKQKCTYKFEERKRSWYIKIGGPRVLEVRYHVGKAYYTVGMRESTYELAKKNLPELVIYKNWHMPNYVIADKANITKVLEVLTKVMNENGVSVTKKVKKEGKVDAVK